MKTSDIIYLSLCTFCLVATNGYYYTYGSDTNFFGDKDVTFLSIKDTLSKNPIIFNLDPLPRGGIGFAKYETLINEYPCYGVSVNGPYYSIYKISREIKKQPDPSSPNLSESSEN
jgi:hypothetical protein